MSSEHLCSQWNNTRRTMHQKMASCVALQRVQRGKIVGTLCNIHISDYRDSREGRASRTKRTLHEREYLQSAHHTHERISRLHLSTLILYAFARHIFFTAINLCDCLCVFGTIYKICDTNKLMSWWQRHRHMQKTTHFLLFFSLLQIVAFWFGYVVPLHVGGTPAVVKWHVPGPNECAV